MDTTAKRSEHSQLASNNTHDSTSFTEKESNLIAGAIPEEDITVKIDSAGDLLVKIWDEVQDQAIAYRVSSSILRNASAYFETLLDPSKFSEGLSFNAILGKLRTQDKDISSVPTTALPVVLISDAGVLSAGASNQDVVTHFFKILHKLKHVPVKNCLTHIAQLTIVADRFAVFPPIAAYVTKRNIKQSIKEVAWRQRIFVGYVLDIPDWVVPYSRLLVNRGSIRWTDNEDDVAAAKGKDEPWWNLPGGLEEELIHRRGCILATINSLQDHFLRRYSSRKRQCRLGYDTSSQCDSFQLGEMVRFFTRKGTLNLQSSINGQDYKPSYTGSIEALFQSLRQCPAYQLDNNHSHCGLRSKIIPLLDYVDLLTQPSTAIGLCLRCWKAKKATYSWLANPAKETWRVHINRNRDRIAPLECGLDHDSAKCLFTAEDRDWTSDF